MSEQKKTQNAFAELASVDVSAHVEKKNGLSYLSWPYAILQLKKKFPNSSWRIERFNPTTWLKDPSGVPYQATPLGFFVEVAVIVEGVEISHPHPIMDHKMKAMGVPDPKTGLVVPPDVRDVNDSLMRCLVKAIAMHGLGLNLYAGEDLPLERDAAADAREESERAARAAAAQTECAKQIAALAGISDVDRIRNAIRSVAKTFANMPMLQLQFTEAANARLTELGAPVEAPPTKRAVVLL